MKRSYAAFSARFIHQLISKPRGLGQPVFYRACENNLFGIRQVNQMTDTHKNRSDIVPGPDNRADPFIPIQQRAHGTFSSSRFSIVTSKPALGAANCRETDNNDYR